MLGVWLPVRAAAVVGLVALVVANVWLDSTADDRPARGGDVVGALGRLPRAVGGCWSPVRRRCTWATSCPCARWPFAAAWVRVARPSYAGRGARRRRPRLGRGLRDRAAAMSLRLAAPAGPARVEWRGFPPRCGGRPGGWCAGRRCSCPPGSPCCSWSPRRRCSTTATACGCCAGPACCWPARWSRTVDDPSGEVAAASPFPRAVRTAVRVLAGAAVVVTSWVVAAVLVEWRAPDVPVLGAGARGAGARRARAGGGHRAAGLARPAQPAHTSRWSAVVAIAFLTSALPRWYALQQGQTWGPPWEAAQIRWFARAAASAAASSRSRCATRSPGRRVGQTGPKDPWRPLGRPD